MKIILSINLEVYLKIKKINYIIKTDKKTRLR